MLSVGKVPLGEVVLGRACPPQWELTQGTLLIPPPKGFPLQELKIEKVLGDLVNHRLNNSMQCQAAGGKAIRLYKKGIY